MQSIQSIGMLLGGVMLMQASLLQAQSASRDDYQFNEIKITKQTKKETMETAALMKEFNNAFSEHNPDLLIDLVSEDCVMESIQGPDGVRYEGYEACLAFWQALATDPATRFEVEEVFVAGDRATIRWRYWWGTGDAESVRGVNLMRVRNGKITEALGYSKTMPATGLDRK